MTRSQAPPSANPSPVTHQPSPSITVELFGVPRLLEGARSISAAGATLADLAADLLRRQPAWRVACWMPRTGWPLDGYSFVVDEQFTRDRRHCRSARHVGAPGGERGRRLTLWPSTHRRCARATLARRAARERRGSGWTEPLPRRIFATSSAASGWPASSCSGSVPPGADPLGPRQSADLRHVTLCRHRHHDRQQARRRRPLAADRHDRRLALLVLPGAGAETHRPRRAGHHRRVRSWQRAGHRRWHGSPPARRPTCSDSSRVRRRTALRAELGTRVPRRRDRPGRRAGRALRRHRQRRPSGRAHRQRRRHGRQAAEGDCGPRQPPPHGRRSALAWPRWRAIWPRAAWARPPPSTARSAPSPISPSSTAWACCRRAISARSGHFAEAEAISGETLRLEHHTGQHACAACTVGCEHHYRTRDGGPETSARLEYETLFALGSLVRRERPERRPARRRALRRARDGRHLGRRHDRLGDGVPANAASIWACRGTDLPGWGDGAALLRTLRQIGVAGGAGRSAGRRFARGGGRASARAATRGPCMSKGSSCPATIRASCKTLALGLAVADARRLPQPLLRLRGRSLRPSRSGGRRPGARRGQPRRPRIRRRCSTP